MTSILEKRFDRLKAKAMAKTRGPMIVRRIINGDPEAEIQRMVAAAEVSTARLDDKKFLPAMHQSSLRCSQYCGSVSRPLISRSGWLNLKS
jgi:hypothetical protein